MNLTPVFAIFGLWKLRRAGSRSCLGDENLQCCIAAMPVKLTLVRNSINHKKQRLMGTLSTPMTRL
jgi:hypothetical protein